MQAMPCPDCKGEVFVEHLWELVCEGCGLVLEPCYVDDPFCGHVGSGTEPPRSFLHTAAAEDREDARYREAIGDILESLHLQSPLDVHVEKVFNSSLDHLVEEAKKYEGVTTEVRAAIAVSRHLNTIVRVCAVLPNLPPSKLQRHMYEHVGQMSLSVVVDDVRWLINRASKVSLVEGLAADECAAFVRTPKFEALVNLLLRENKPAASHMAVAIGAKMLRVKPEKRPDTKKRARVCVDGKRHMWDFVVRMGLEEASEKPPPVVDCLCEVVDEFFSGM